MAVHQEIWDRAWQGNLYEQAPYLNRSKNHASYVVGSLVHLPQSGSKPGIVKNRSGAGTIAERADSVITYPVDSFTTDPIRVKNFDELQLSINKREDVIGDHRMTLNEEIATNVNFNWFENVTTILPTSGATGGALPDSATGSRKLVSLDEIRKAQTALNKDLMPQTGRSMLVPSDLMEEILAISTVVNANENGLRTLGEGVVTRLYGFDIYERPTTVSFDNSVIIPVGGTPTPATDQFAILFWHESAVAIADDGVNVMIDSGDTGTGAPTQYGVVISAERNMGSRSLREDNRGVGVIVQAVI